MQGPKLARGGHPKPIACKGLLKASGSWYGLDDDLVHPWVKCYAATHVVVFVGIVKENLLRRYKG